MAPKMDDALAEILGEDFELVDDGAETTIEPSHPQQMDVDDASFFTRKIIDKDPGSHGSYEEFHQQPIDEYPGQTDYLDQNADLHQKLHDINEGIAQGGGSDIAGLAHAEELEMRRKNALVPAVLSTPESFRRALLGGNEMVVQAGGKMVGDPRDGPDATRSRLRSRSSLGRSVRSRHRSARSTAEMCSDRT